MDRATQYPHHLARLVAERLRSDGGRSPPETVLTELLETLYFASLKAEEGRRIVATVNYVDPAEAEREPPARTPPDRWAFARFERPLPFEVRTLRKLGRAADPAVASLAVYGDRKRGLFIWGMVDQEPRYAEGVSLESPAAERPGTFQVIVTGPGNLAVYCRGTLVASLVQNALVEQYHNVLWAGPVHAILRENLRAALAWQAGCRGSPGGGHSPDPADPDDDVLEQQLVVHSIHAVCRILAGIQQYRRGGGVLVVPHDSLDGLSVDYLVKYDRLPRALVGLVQSYLHRDRARTAEQVAAFLAEVDRRKSEVAGAIRFIAALSCADGVVWLDRGLGVRGFGVDIRVDHPLDDVFLAGDVRASASRLRRVDLGHFGKRHRAILRYCSRNPGSLGLVVSRDGEVDAVTQLDGRVVLWENVDLHPALGAEPTLPPGEELPGVVRRVTTREH